MQLTTLIIAGVILLLVILTIIGLLSRYRKCPSDQLLVVYGNKSKSYNEECERMEKEIANLKANIAKNS